MTNTSSALSVINSMARSLLLKRCGWPNGQSHFNATFFFKEDSDYEIVFALWNDGDDWELHSLGSFYGPLSNVFPVAISR